MSTNTSLTPVLTPEHLATAYSYGRYRKLIDELQAEGKTTGPQQSEALSHYTHLNVQRMQRLDKTTQLLPELREAVQNLKQSYAWLILTEGWCGDAAQIVPVLEAVAQASHGRFTTHYFLRDENLALMDRYLTNGGRSIPKLVVLRADTLVEVAQWGPRPADAQQVFVEMKAQGVTKEEFAEKLHAWYARDKTQAIQRELLALVRTLA
ncbi:thioredoxin family protein [Hymenobacter taeanensis]|uniref:Thioredoxin family protein n=1 Tax=Hymenobacter taeanensis TaxID=2735321 RepID=A0A6M6BG44_9BACT|nr:MULTISPECIES: thioredoxin family protein [Hymenobacter]QJX46714.1 thioredoxin family protein [Hymenobacter taeanensis]UOQ80580.1 thioredoxin family protein [Hymenobacter sp. 5414T-23]